MKGDGRLRSREAPVLPHDDAATALARRPGPANDRACAFVVDHDLEQALKLLRSQLGRANILREVRDRSAYQPPSARRRLKSRRARGRASKAARRRTEAETTLGE